MIQAAALSLPLAAGRESFMYLGDRFRAENTAFGPITVGIGAIAAIVVITILWLIARSRRPAERKTINHPRKLLRELAEAHGLSSGQERLLNRLIRHYNVEPPAAIFLAPERLEAAVGDVGFRAERSAILQLKERLFASAG
jgi:hypothetical protein